MTHTPGYGVLIALGLLNSLKRLDHSSEEIEAAEAYLEFLCESGRFLTYASGGPLIGARLREDESERSALRLISETDEGIVVTGKIQMHTSTPFAHDLLVGSMNELPPGSGRHLWFIVPVNARGIRVVARRPAVKHENPFLSPLSSRFDELDSMVWLEDVFVPRSRVFTGEPARQTRRHSLVCWLLWHHSYGWLAKAELTLGLALALAEVMGLKQNPRTVEQLVELTVNVQTTRSCLTASELDPETTASGYALPKQLHVAAGGINILRVRQRMAEILRGLPGSSLVNAPTDTDFAIRQWPRSWKTPLAGRAILQCNERRCCSSPGTRYRRALTDERQLSSSMPVVVWMCGAAVWPPGLTGTASWPTAFRSLSRWTCRTWT